MEYDSYKLFAVRTLVYDRLRAPFLTVKSRKEKGIVNCLHSMDWFAVRSLPEFR